MRETEHERHLKAHQEMLEGLKPIAEGMRLREQARKWRRLAVWLNVLAGIFTGLNLMLTIGRLRGWWP